MISREETGQEGDLGELLKACASIERVWVALEHEYRSGFTLPSSMRPVIIWQDLVSG